MAKSSSKAAPNSSTNLRNRVNKLFLPKTKPLLPLFEVISNAIHAINERKNYSEDKRSGIIRIRIIRNGDDATYKKLPDNDSYPIHSFEITDNGIGLNEENYLSFQEFDSEYKLDIGGKGVGRLVCLKAFHSININSVYRNGDQWKLRSFEYKKTKDGFENYEEKAIEPKNSTGTKITLYKYDDEYGKKVPRAIIEIAREIVSHFQLYFIKKRQPEITIMNQNGDIIDLTGLYEREFKKEVETSNFTLSSSQFEVYITKSHNAKSNKILYCAHERVVKDEGLSQYITDLNIGFKDSSDQSTYYYQVYVVSEYLNKTVNEERTGFHFALDDDDSELEFSEITLAKIRRESLVKIEALLSNFLTVLRTEKMQQYIPIIKQEFPNYSIVVNYNRDKVSRLPANLPKEELNLKLFEIESEWKLDVKKKGIEILKKKKDATTLPQYKKIYEEFMEEFNDVGKSDLARYIVHRRTIIDLLDKLIELNTQGKFEDEELIHSIFFPVREKMNTIEFEKQNLWLLDERLTFNTFLASDKQFKSIKELNSSSSDRMDLVIKKEDVYDYATLYSENKYPFESFTIIEFKKPNRNDYKYGDEKLDPIYQVRRYIRNVIDGNAKMSGRTIEAKINTPFYCYIIADITPTLLYILQEERFTPTPDGIGHFNFYDTANYKAYIEVVPFKKIIKDSKQRNKVLFDKLNINP
jgi:hypothetical protein